MNIKEAYEVMQKASGIEVGDKVRVLRKFKNYEMGFKCIYGSAAGVKIGSELEVKKVGTEGIKLIGGDQFPFFVLEIVEKHKDEKMITIDGKEWSKSTIKAALQEHAK